MSNLTYWSILIAILIAILYTLITLRNNLMITHGNNQ